MHPFGSVQIKNCLERWKETGEMKEGSRELKVSVFIRGMC